METTETPLNPPLINNFVCPAIKTDRYMALNGRYTSLVLWMKLVANLARVLAVQSIKSCILGETTPFLVSRQISYAHAQCLCNQLVDH